MRGPHDNVDKYRAITGAATRRNKGNYPQLRSRRAGHDISVPGRWSALGAAGQGPGLRWRKQDPTSLGGGKACAVAPHTHARFRRGGSGNGRHANGREHTKDEHCPKHVHPRWKRCAKYQMTQRTSEMSLKIQPAGSAPRARLARKWVAARAAQHVRAAHAWHMQGFGATFRATLVWHASGRRPRSTSPSKSPRSGPLSRR